MSSERVTFNAILLLRSSVGFAFAFNLYVKAPNIRDEGFNICIPRTIPSGSVVCSIIELGRLSELQTMFRTGLASSFDISPSAKSLVYISLHESLHTTIFIRSHWQYQYATARGRNYIHRYLISKTADPFFRDAKGMWVSLQKLCLMIADLAYLCNAANQRGVDRTLTGMVLNSEITTTGPFSTYDLFIDYATLEQQSFDTLALAISGCVRLLKFFESYYSTFMACLELLCGHNVAIYGHVWCWGEGWWKVSW